MTASEPSGTPTFEPRQGASGLGAVFAIGLVACGIVLVTTGLPAPSPKRTASAVEAHGDKHAVATDNADATRVALQVLREGGDAVDAAAAAALTLGVVSPTASGIGGGGFAMVWREKGKRLYVLDFRETAPAAVDVAALDKRPLKPGDPKGVLTGVPGEIAGLGELVARFGNRTWAEDVRPAVLLATNGFAISPFIRRVVKMLPGPIKLNAPAIGLPILAQAGPIPDDARAYRPELGKTLSLLATQGPGAFYRGALADAIVAGVRAQGGTLTADDLAGYRTRERDPLRLSLGAREVVTMPPPSAGGVMLLQALVGDRLLRAQTGKGLDRDPLGSGAYLHRVAELMRGSLDDKARSIGDPDVVKVDVAPLLSDEHLAARLSMMRDDVTHAPKELHVEDHGTTHISIVDDDGDVVALTTTVNTLFGAKYVAGDTGIVMNDELDDFSPSTSAMNGPRPFARPVSSMTPTMIFEDGEPVLVLGGSGGTRIATSVTLVTLSRLVFGVALGDAIAWPRIHTSDAVLQCEEELPRSIRDDLVKRGETIVVAPTINGVQAIALDRSSGARRLSAVADPRKFGLALAE